MYYTFSDDHMLTLNWLHNLFKTNISKYHNLPQEYKDYLISEWFISILKHVIHEAAYRIQPSISDGKYGGVMLMIQPLYPGK